MGIVIAKPVVADFPPMFLMAWRFFVAAIILVWFVPVPHKQLGLFTLIALVGATLQYAFTFNGLRFLDAGTTGLIVQAEVPFLVLIAAIFLKEKIGPRQLTGMAVAFLGIYLLSGQPSLQGQRAAIAMVLAGGFLWAIGQVLVRRLGDIGGLQVTAWLAVMATPQLLIASLLLEENHYQLMVESDFKLWISILYLGVVMTVVGYGCWFHVLGKYEARQVAPYLLLTPVASVVGGVVFLGEQLSAIGVIGGLIILVGVALLVLEPKPANEIANAS